MATLRQCLQQAGLVNVRTLTQSGNVIFESDARSATKLTTQIVGAVSAALGIDLRIVLVSETQLKTIVMDAPADWARRADLRRNVAFLRPSVTANHVLKQLDPKPGIDSVKPGKGVVYLATVMSGLHKSGLRKLIGTPVYQEMTIRTYGTCQKILALMEDRRDALGGGQIL